jgi:hypothetical protein
MSARSARASRPRGESLEAMSLCIRATQRRIGTTAERDDMCPLGFDAVTRQEMDRPRSARFGV